MEVDKEVIEQRIREVSTGMDRIKSKHTLEIAEESNTLLQDFVIWLKGYLDKH